jgi:hypothetical protein
MVPKYLPSEDTVILFKLHAAILEGSDQWPMALKKEIKRELRMNVFPSVVVFLSIKNVMKPHISSVVRQGNFGWIILTVLVVLVVVVVVVPLL